MAWGVVKVGKCNILDGKLFVGTQHINSKLTVIHGESDFFVLVIWPNNGPGKHTAYLEKGGLKYELKLTVLLAVHSRADRPYDGQYVRKSVENYINFRPDLKRVLKDSFSKLIWK